jgi:SagB-type dehydrogenase family enzyme
VVEELGSLVRHGGLVEWGTPAAKRDVEYADSWKWGLQAGVFHFGIKDPAIANEAETDALLRQIAERDPRPPLFTRNEGHADVASLPAATSTGFMRLVRQRRSRRTFADEPISLESLSDCLYAGLAVDGWIDHPILGELPHAMTPSAGALNPYEAYVLAQRVEGLSPGLYHYSAVEHTLGLEPRSQAFPAALALGGQQWAEQAAALILLVAHFDRSMWKYRHPDAFRAVLIEAGHIGQNITLAATAHELAAVGSSTIADSVAEPALGLTALTEAFVYGIGLGIPRRGI